MPRPQPGGGAFDFHSCAANPREREALVMCNRIPPAVIRSAGATARPRNPTAQGIRPYHE